MIEFGWFSSGRDQAAIELFKAVCNRLADGFDLTKQVEEYLKVSSGHKV